MRVYFIIVNCKTSCLKYISVLLKAHFLQFTNMRLLGNLIGSNNYFDVYKLGMENIFSQIGSLRDVWCVNMFSSYMISVNEEYAKDRC